MKLIKNALLLVALLPLAAFAQSEEAVKSFTLVQAQEYAMQNNDSLKLAALDIEKARKQVKETTAIGLPQVSGSLSLQYFFDIPTQLLPDFVSPAVYGVLLQEGVPIMTAPEDIPSGGMTPAQFGTEYNVSAGVSVNQLIFDGQYIVGLRASRAFQDLSASMRNTSEVNVKATVAKLYLQVLMLNETQSILEKNMDELDNNITELTALVKEGLSDQIDVDRLLLSKRRLDNQVANIENAHAVVRLLLKLQMGYPVEKPVDLTDNLDMHIGDAVTLLAEESNAASRPEYKTLELNRDLQVLDMQRWRAGYLPQVAGFFSYTENALVNELKLGDGDNWFPTTVAGLSVNIPIFDGFSKQAKIQQAKVEIQKAEIGMHQFEQAAHLQVEQAKANYELAQVEFETEKASLELSQKIYDRSKVLYQEGLGSSFEMTAALTELNTAQSAYLQASYKLITTRINLEKALGKYN